MASSSILTENHNYKDGPKDETNIRIYLPPTNELDGIDLLRPAILDVHGGAWTNRNLELDKFCNEALAAAGFIVAAIDFRMGPKHQHPAASQDVVTALQWLRNDETAKKYRIDPDKIGFLGSSSGGHLALLAGLIPNAYHHSGMSNMKIAPPKFIIALWPVSCPFQRYKYAKRINNKNLITWTEGYFGTEDLMQQASIPRVVIANEAESLPPLLIVQPGEDENVPFEITLDLMRSWQNRGGYLEYSFFPGMSHSFGCKNESPRMNNLIVEFAKRALNM